MALTQQQFADSLTEEQKEYLNSFLDGLMSTINRYDSTFMKEQEGLAADYK